MFYAAGLLIGAFATVDSIEIVPEHCHHDTGLQFRFLFVRREYPIIDRANQTSFRFSIYGLLAHVSGC